VTGPAEREARRLVASTGRRALLHCGPGIAGRGAVKKFSLSTVFTVDNLLVKQ
jgi:hypothetical protein